jgi:hypothetical protein
VGNLFHNPTKGFPSSLPTQKVLRKKSEFYFILSRFFQATNLVVTVTTQEKATQRAAITVTVAPLQLGTVWLILTRRKKPATSTFITS